MAVKTVCGYTVVSIGGRLACTAVISPTAICPKKTKRYSCSRGCFVEVH